jgi:hypothetical protein
MDTIQFTSQIFVSRGYDMENDEEDEESHTEISIYINGRNLLDLAQQVERGVLDPQNFRIPSDRSYAGLNPEWRPNLRNEFLGITAEPYSVLLTCTCYEDYCNSIIAKIEVGLQTVTWRDFTSVLYGEEARSWGGTPIDYSSLGPFVFDRNQYMEALDALHLNE